MRPSIRRREADISYSLQSAAISPLLKRIYAGRGVVDAAELSLTLRGLIPPERLHGAADAAVLLADAIEGEARVVIVGDFDCDGATSSALAVDLLQQMGLREVSYLVPNRFEFGYGLSPEIVALAAERVPDLIVTVDNGISSIDGVACAREMGISVLVTDHHLPGPTLPQADVIVNPNQPACSFPSKSLAGVGVMFYVLTALRAELRRRDWFRHSGIEEPNLGDALDLVALGTVADVVPLDRNNRILVAAGLARMHAGRARPGIAALFEVAGRDITQASSTDLGFIAGPRLNAAGRLDDMSLGIECLLSQSTLEARPRAEELDRLNRERRQIEQGMQAEALKRLEDADVAADAMPFALSVHDDSFHQGVVGIVASRLKEKFHRPTIVFADAGDGDLKGSGRSLPEVHLRDVLARVDALHPGMIRKFGGHAMAAGLTLDGARFDQFSAAFNEAVAEALGHHPPEPVYDSDGELAGAEVTLPQAEALRAAGPWGQKFPEPVFDGVFDVIDQRIVGERHLKLRLRVDGQMVDGIAFNIEPLDWAEPVQRVGALYRLDVNEFRGERKPQLNIVQVWPE